jgi:type ISP restriction-modification system protein/N-6 DNA methylase
MLVHEKLPFEVRASTSESRSGGGHDLPDIALYDGNGDFIVVCGEVKLPSVEIADLANSTERNDQIGRYLAQTGVVLLTNVRAFGLLTVKRGASRTATRISPADRVLELVVELWPSSSALQKGKAIPDTAIEELFLLLETAVTRYAPIAEPESLAKILARQAKRAKAQLPAQFTQAVRGLADDFGKALGVSFEGEDGEEFFRSSLIQTVFYGLFAGWTLWLKSKARSPFRWENLSEHLKIPFLAELYHEFQHPRRIQELGLRPHLDLATETLHRVDTPAFFRRFHLPSVRDHKPEEGHEEAAAAVMYFYEPFLEAFDPELRKTLGVWYTPPEVVRYQIRTIDRLLREELDCDRGFADDKVIVLDPCCGTGAYLIEVMNCVLTKIKGGAVVESELMITHSFFGAAKGGWINRAAAQSEPMYVQWGEQTGDLFINDAVFFKHVPENVWRYEIGGYPVIKKWLGYRDKSRRPDVPLNVQEANHLRGMVHRIAAVLLLQEQLDTLYDRAIQDCFTAEELGLEA